MNLENHDPSETMASVPVVASRVRSPATRVLVVDDDNGLRAALEVGFRRRGWQVQMAASMSSAVEQFRRAPAELVVTDMRMPQGDGLSVLQELRRISPGLPVIMLTAYANVPDAVAAMKHGACEYLAMGMHPPSQEHNTETGSPAANPIAHQSSPADSVPSRPEPLQIVSFHIGEEEFGLDILRVQEIIRVQDLTRVPNSPSFVDGVINLRGKVIPVVALRKRFGLGTVPHDKQTRIVVIEVGGAVLGFIVDSVSEVLRIPAETIAPPPRLGKVEREYVSGVGKLDNRLLILLDVDRLMHESEDLVEARAS